MATTTPAFNPEGLRVFSWTKRAEDDPRFITPLIRMDTRYWDDYGPAKAIEQMKARPKNLRWVYLHAIPDPTANLYADPVAWLLSGANECVVKEACMPFLRDLVAYPPETFFVDVEWSIDPGDQKVGAMLAAWQKDCPRLLPVHLRTAKWNIGNRHVLGSAVSHFVTKTRNAMLKRALPVKELLGANYINFCDSSTSSVGGFSSPALYNADKMPAWANYTHSCADEIAKVGPSKFIPWFDKTGQAFATVLRGMGCKTFFYFNAADGGNDYAAVDSTKLFLS